MSYDLQAVEMACREYGFPYVWLSDCEMEIEICPPWTPLVVANTDGGKDTYLGFKELPWHSHGNLLLIVSDTAHIEYFPEELIEAIASGDVLVVSQFLGDELNDRWLVHRDEKQDVRYLEPTEELRICRLSQRHPR